MREKKARKKQETMIKTYIYIYIYTVYIYIQYIYIYIINQRNQKKNNLKGMMKPTVKQFLNDMHKSRKVHYKGICVQCLN